ncbi:hypothetical protein MHYMCMPSP_01094, partial [Hyalomma marginatum]
VASGQAGHSTSGQGVVGSVVVVLVGVEVVEVLVVVEVMKVLVVVLTGAAVVIACPGIGVPSNTEIVNLLQ